MNLEIAHRVFSLEDQELFATYSGDRNPMHMDMVAARRTKAGFAVVHGVHTVLWCLEALAKHEANLPPVTAVKVSFENFVYVGADVSAHLVQQDGAGVRIEALTNGLVAMRLVIKFGEPTSKALVIGPFPDRQNLETPLDLAMSEMQGQCGRLLAFSSLDASDELFPNATQWLGASRLSALATASYLVGMVCPGLHSTFRSVSLSTCEIGYGEHAIDFQVTSIDARFRMVKIDLSGGGWDGSIVTHARPVPTTQCSMKDIVGIVMPGEFSGLKALVIGGSRGLGELSAKILAAGGAETIITYAIGQEEALNVRDEILINGGRCESIAVDVTKPIANQLEGLAFTPNALYYFATPQIGRQKNLTFDYNLYMEFSKFYISAFYEIFNLFSKERNLEVFYPSSVFVESTPPELVEYAMAKASAEFLCLQLNSLFEHSRITWPRLPRLPTDQTAGMTEAADENPVDIMLTLMRELHNSAKRYSS